LPLLDLLLRDLLCDFTSSSGSSSDAGYTTGDGENGGIFEVSVDGGDSDGDLIPNDEADGTDGGLDGGLGSEPGSDGSGITGKSHLNQPGSGS